MFPLNTPVGIVDTVYLDVIATRSAVVESELTGFWVIIISFSVCAMLAFLAAVLT